MASAADIEQNSPSFIPFEGPEKLLELWFAPSAIQVPPSPSLDGKTGLRVVQRHVWEEMLDIVRCKILSVVEGSEMDAYLLSESSFFVSPHRLILKTCGTTLNLLGLPRILEIAATQANLPTVYRCFYSRKSFMFPERQSGPHRGWKEEVDYLDKIFNDGAAYTIGKVNGDHWLLYLTNPDYRSPRKFPQHDLPLHSRHSDFTIEILMSDLSQTARIPFFSHGDSTDLLPELPSAQATTLSVKTGISSIFPAHLTTLDAYAFDPCGYSSNALIKWGDESFNTSCSSQSKQTGEGYFTIHVTPEEGWSYASFECNVPLSSALSHHGDEDTIPNLNSLVKRVVNIFQPGRLTLTLFISSSENNDPSSGETAVDLAQRAFKNALAETPESGQTPETSRKYRRTDKINYEFGGYDLAFASFELK